MVLYSTVGTCMGVSKTSVSKGPNAIDQPRETSSFDANDSWETSKRVFQGVFLRSRRGLGAVVGQPTSENIPDT